MSIRGVLALDIKYSEENETGDGIEDLGLIRNLQKELNSWREEENSRGKK